MNESESGQMNKLESERGRCFIRPSGTEDVVRVYAEAKSKKSASALAGAAAVIINECIGCGSCESKL